MGRFTTHLKKSVSALVLAISFFFVTSLPVHADYDVDTYTVDTWQVLAYEYWNKMGFNYTQSFSNSTNIAVPQYYTETGNTGYSLICNNNNYTGDENDYACFYRSNSTGQIYGTWNRYTNVAHTETEQNISLQGAEIPWLHGTYIHDTAYNSNARAAFLPGGGDLYLSFITSVNTYNGTNYDATAVAANPHVMVYSQDAITNTIGFEVVSSSQINGCYWLTFRFHNNDSGRHWLNINFPRLGTGNNETKIIPYYVGSGNDLSDAQKQTLNIATNTESMLNDIASKIAGMSTNLGNISNATIATNNNIVSGNPTSQAAQSALNNSNTTLNNRVDQMNNIETEYNSDLNAALDDIDLSTDLVQHTGFTNAALWVSAQFNRLVIGTPFELVITFSLITGLALVLIGKMRG